MIEPRSNAWFFIISHSRERVLFRKTRSSFQNQARSEKFFIGLALLSKCKHNNYNNTTLAVQFTTETIV